MTVKMLPCLNEKGMSLFSVTADQRFMIGEDIFLKTHYPITLRRFRDGKPNSPWTEGELIKHLTKQKGAVQGNRVYVLYGAAGSGKSELMRWIECNLKSSGERKNHYVRISRTELDPVRILQKILHQFSGIGIDTNTVHRWDDLRKKPVTLANHLVWSALCRLLSDDSQIIPLSYKLRPIIEANLKENFGAIEGPSEIGGRNLELISVEELEQLADQCAFPVNIDYEQIRSMMVHEMEQMIMGGFHFVDVLKSVSFEVAQETSCRPVLLVDDLVQSMNLYASDILDYFITMEEGCWDIVVGLTPSSFEASRRGRELLKRITYLDTFDDRLIKLWLTDEQGHESFFINAENCSDYAKKYLLELKGQGGFSCGPGCDSYEKCQALQFDMAPDAALAPFNPAVLHRMFNSLPRGKGKARYFIMALGEVIQRLISGESLHLLASLVRREIDADHEDKHIKVLAEIFSPVGDSEGDITVPGLAISLLRGNDILEPDIKVSLATLGDIRPKGGQTEEAPYIEEDSFETYYGPREAIRDWLEENKVNKELLRGLRLGAAHFCREIAQPGSISREYTARPPAVIKREEALDGSKIPIHLEEVDEYSGIPLERSIGHAAYELHYLHLKKSKTKELALDKLCAAGPSYRVAYRARGLRKTWVNNLGEELKMPVDEAIYVLFLFMIQYTSQIEEIPAILAQYRLMWIRERYPQGLTVDVVEFSPEEVDFVTDAFKDWFLLRENVYDGFTLSILEKKYSGQDLFTKIQGIQPENISSQYKINGRPLSDLLLGIRQKVKESLKLLNSARVESYLNEISRLALLLQDIQSPGMYEVLSSGLGDLSETLKEQNFRQLPSKRQCGRLYRKLTQYIGNEIASNSTSVLSLPPMQIHHAFLALSEIEQDPTMKNLRDVLTLGSDSLVSYAPEIKGELLEMAGALPVRSVAGVALQRHAKKILVTGKKCSFSGAELILENIELARKYLFVKEYLFTINRVAKHLEKDQIQEAVRFSKIISGLCPGGQTLPGTSEDSLALASEGRNFLSSLRRLISLDYHAGESLAELEGKISSCAITLQEIDSNAEVKKVIAAWRTHLSRLLQINDLLAKDNRKQLTEKVDVALNALKDLDTNVSSNALACKAVRALREIAWDDPFRGLSYEDIMSEMDLGRGAARVVSELARGGYVVLSDVPINAIKELKDKSSALAGEIKLNYIFKE